MVVFCSFLVMFRAVAENQNPPGAALFFVQAAFWDRDVRQRGNAPEHCRRRQKLHESAAAVRKECEKTPVTIVRLIDGRDLQC